MLGIYSSVHLNCTFFSHKWMWEKNKNVKKLWNCNIYLPPFIKKNKNVIINFDLSIFKKKIKNIIDLSLLLVPSPTTPMSLHVPKIATYAFVSLWVTVEYFSSPPRSHQYLRTTCWNCKPVPPSPNTSHVVQGPIPFHFPPRKPHTPLSHSLSG